MSEAFKRRAKKKAKKGRRILVAAMAAAMAFGNIGYVHAAGVDDVFDEHYYADQYPDLKAAFGYSRSALLKHFMKFGLAEGRVMNEMIDIVKYRAIYKDLQAAFGDDWDKYIEHYLAHGAFEKRDNGTDFDPVDYLNRYNELQATFGSDLLSAYKHYKEYGKQEGRDGRSENVIVAERRAAEYQAALESQAETSEPSEPSAEYSEPEDTWEPEPEAPPEEPSRPSETPSEPSGPSEPEKGSFEIQSVEVVGTGRIRVTLNQKTEQPLTLEAFSIICNSGGSDMTIRSVSTDDNKVYDLATTYYRDQEYDIQITLADGTTISKVFEYRTDCAQITSINAARTSASEARITYHSDEPGYFYYILRESGQVAAQAASDVTEEEVIGDGVKIEMLQYENAFTITGLSEGMAYTMYYVAVNTEEKATLVNSLSIDGGIYEETATAIKRAEAFAEEQADGYLYGFEIELENATSEPLTLDQFEISCPQGPTTLEDISTSDNRVYRVYMDRYGIPSGTNTYTILINLKDGSQLKGSCHLDLQEPRVDIRSIEWKDADTIEVTVNSDEAGTLYYAIQDEVEDEGTIEGKDPSEIYASGNQASMGYGLNYITVSGVNGGQWFCCATEDAKGNRADFYNYKQIPEYTAPDPGEDTTQPEITGVTVLSASNNARLKVVFNQNINGLYDNSLTQISGIDQKLLLEATYSSEGDLEDNVLTIRVVDPSVSIPEGSHTLTLHIFGTRISFYYTL